ncbi:MAG TPA: hypothetical protein VHX14_17590 [Thermoanaerobaculia bacterium]|nr:hypothetical protein [Thermoanaerobaculia bacterium]
MISLLVAGFLFYLYAPHLLFKFAAASKYDLITPKEIPQVEEFFSAGLPGLILNIQAALVLRAGRLLFARAPITIDWSAVAVVFRKDPDLSSYAAGGNVSALLTYAAVLGLTSWMAGWWYGMLLRKVALAGGRTRYFQQHDTNLNPFNRIGRALAVFVTRFWDTFYAQYQDPFYPVVLRRSYAFVHTEQGLYHGIVYGADKKRDGDIEGIVLIGVSKFSRGHEAELIAAGRNPIRDLAGPFFIKWSEITDINYPPDAGTLENKRAEYQKSIDDGAAKRGSGASFDAAPPLEELSPAGTVTTNG